MLKEAPRPDVVTAGQSRRCAGPVYWKTGTSFSFRDAWTVGIFDRYVLAVWVGNFDGQSNPAFVGRSAAAPLFFQLVEALRALPQESDLPLPSLESHDGLAVKAVGICSASGQLVGRHCPHAVQGWFIPGVSPIQTCQVHREVVVDARTGLRVSQWNDPSGIRREVYEFWPSDLLECFQQAGIPRRLPPPFAADGPLQQRDAGGIPPEILSPRKGMTYHLRVDADHHDTLALRACADGGVRMLYWFADKTFLGTTMPGETFYWKAAPGSFVLHAVDDQGRSDSRPVAVTMVE
jgi:penicillin-binding protein 1C